jgi:hypothetical protein
MKNTQKKPKNVLRSLINWGILLFLFGSFIVALFWEEQLAIRPFDHILLAIGLVVIFYTLLFRWNLKNDTNWDDPRLIYPPMQQENPGCENSLKDSTEK